MFKIRNAISIFFTRVSAEITNILLARHILNARVLIKKQWLITRTQTVVTLTRSNKKEKRHRYCARSFHTGRTYNYSIRDYEIRRGNITRPMKTRFRSILEIKFTNMKICIFIQHKLTTAVTLSWTNTDII